MKLVHIEKRNKNNISIQSDVEYFSHCDRLKKIKKEGGQGMMEIIASILFTCAFVFCVFLLVISSIS